MSRNIYLTIDDGPSQYTKEKVDFLCQFQIPCIFYVRGEHIAKYEDQLIYAIQKGIMIGNHTFHHIPFSELTIDQIEEEILGTEELIDQAYQKVRCVRPAKIIRFGFADRGAGPKAAEAKTASERDKVQHIQDFLKAHGFVKVNFGADHQDDYIDSFWDWDTQDYKKRLIENPQEYMQQMQKFYEQSKLESLVLLLHDFDHNHDLFLKTIEFLQNERVQFLEAKFE